MKTKAFALGDVLSITTGKLVSPRHMQGVYEILNFMTADNLFTHQLPRACRECAPALLLQFPQLVDLDTSGVDKDTWQDWLAEQMVRFGATLDVEPLPPHAHEVIDPMSELAEKIHPDRITVVRAG